MLQGYQTLEEVAALANPGQKIVQGNRENLYFLIGADDRDYHTPFALTPEQIKNGQTFTGAYKI